MRNNTESNKLAPLAAPFVRFARVAVKRVQSLLSRKRRRRLHHASYREGEIGLAELVRHRCSMMETLDERRETLSSGQVVVYAEFKYVGDRAFPGGNGKSIQPGHVIIAEFAIGKNQGEFLIAGGSKDSLPKHALFYWANPKKGPGNITIAAV